jgi:hypothetical protein
VARPSALPPLSFLQGKGLKEGSRREDLVPLPSGGVFAEAVLGRFNSAEKIDLTRFWNWHDSPIPITAPEIATIQSGSRAGEEPEGPGKLGAPVVNIQNTPALPDPQGLAAVLQALANGAMFRDMSGLAGTQGLVRAFLEETMRGATEAGRQAGQNMQTAVDYAKEMAKYKLWEQYQDPQGQGQSQRWGSGTTPNNPTVEGGRLNYGRDLDQREMSFDQAPVPLDETPTQSAKPAPVRKQGHEAKQYDAGIPTSPEPIGPAPSGSGRSGISYELIDAWNLPGPTNVPPGMPLTPAQMQVLSWLQFYRGLIVDAEKRWKVDRRAIAGAIAWEALENVMPSAIRIDGFGRSSGPGKVHYSTEYLWGEGDPITKQVETAGYLPRLTMEARRARLATPIGAIDYIGACMSALADITATSKHKFRMRCRPDILAFTYNARDLNTWKKHLHDKPIGDPFVAGPKMGLWVVAQWDYLEAAVGKPDPQVCLLGFIGPPKP